MTTDLIDAPPKLDLLLDTAPHPMQHWEGRFDFTDDEGVVCQFNLIAQLRFGGGVFEGGGSVSLEGQTRSMNVEISGEIHATSVSFAMWMVSEQVRFQHFTCRGALSADEMAIVGDHTYPCWDPETCNCAGGGGSFDMRRVNNAIV